MESREAIDNFQKDCQASLKDLFNKSDDTKCLKYGKTLLVFNSVTKYISAGLIEKLFFYAKLSESQQSRSNHPAVIIEKRSMTASLLKASKDWAISS